MMATTNGNGGALATQRAAMQTMTPRTFAEAMDYATIAAKSALVPKAYQGRPADILIAVQMGSGLGFGPVQSMMAIACINGRPSLYGDAALAVVRRSPECLGFAEVYNEERREWTATARRRGEPDPIIRKFSEAEAKQAGLLSKGGPWSLYPKRMLQMRARGFALRDAFADVLMGLTLAEEAQDIPVDAAPTAQSSEGAGTWRRPKRDAYDAIEASIVEAIDDEAKAPLILEAESDGESEGEQ